MPRSGRHNPGVKLPSNASKQKSGTRADFEHQAVKLETAARVMLERHREADSQPVEADLRQKEILRITRLQTDAAQLRQWLADHPEDRKGSKGTTRKSNRTDNESAKMATSKGVIQGYTGVAAVDAKHQIIVDAQAHGTGSEQELLIPVVKAIQGALNNEQTLITPTSLITADAGYHSEANLKQLAGMEVDALIADNGMRQRDPRFKGQDKHKQTPDPLHNKSVKQKTKKQAAVYRPADFHYDMGAQTCVCPAGKTLYGNGSHCIINGFVAVKFQGAQQNVVGMNYSRSCVNYFPMTFSVPIHFFMNKYIPN